MVDGTSTATTLEVGDALERIARYLGLAVAGAVMTMDGAARTLAECAEADGRALAAAAERSAPGSAAARLLRAAADTRRRAA